MPNWSAAGRGGVDAGQLIQVDAVAPQPPQAPLHRLAQPLGVPLLTPSVGIQPMGEPLGRDHQPLRIGPQRLGDQPLAGPGAVELGGVDELHPQLHGPAQQGARLLAIGGQAHGAKPQPVDRLVPAQGERPHPSSIGRGRVVVWD
jgi:hypothetical protein